MSSRWLWLGIVCLALSWANSVNPVNAQPVEKLAKSDRLVRITYPVADLVVPAAGSPGPKKQGRMADALIQVITNTVSPFSWKQADGEGTIEYFPMGMALVVLQNEKVHADIARLLAELRRMQDVQVSIEMRLVRVSPLMAKHLLGDMDKHGRDVGALNEGEKATTGRCVSMDEKQATAFLSLAQSYESTNITQLPKLTLFNAQRACLDTSEAKEDGLQVEVRATVDAEKKFVRMALNVQHADSRRVTKRAGSVAVATGHTLIWQLGEASKNRQVFVLVMPRVLSSEQEERLFLGQAPPIPGR